MDKILMTSEFAKTILEVIEESRDRPIFLDVRIDDEYQISPIVAFADAYIGESREKSDKIYVISNYSNNSEREIYVNDD